MYLDNLDELDQKIIQLLMEKHVSLTRIPVIKHVFPEWLQNHRFRLWRKDVIKEYTTHIQKGPAPHD